MSDERLHQDEVVSAYLDGEATPAEIAEVEADDALLARLEELRAVRDAVAEPVVPLSAEQRDDLIGAALGGADAEAAARVEAKVVPLRRPQRMLLAAAAAVIVLAAAVGTGLIAGRSGDDAESVAATAAPASAGSAELAEERADAAPEAAEEPMAAMAMEAAEEATAEALMADEEAMAEALMAEEAPAEDAALAADEVEAAPAEATAAEAEAPADELARQAADEAEAAAAPAEPQAAEDAPAASTTTVAAATDGGDDSPTAQVVDLGTLESLESLLEDIEATWSAALEEGATADSGACAAAVRDQALESSADTVRSFVATVGVENPVTFDGRLTRRDDGAAVIVYAAPPDCEVGVRELPDP